MQCFTKDNPDISLRQRELTQQSKEDIKISEYSGMLCILYKGLPIKPLEDYFTTKEILSELSKIRTNYVNSKMKERC